VKLVIGYTTISYVNDVLGEPDTSSVDEYGGEDFYWENLLDNTYYDGKLRLIFSIDKGILVQMIFRPEKGDKYSTFLNVDEKKDKDEVFEAIKKSGREFEIVKEKTIWVDYYKSEAPPYYMYVSSGLQFNDDNSLYAINHFVNAPW
jgi:hypothetical protein